VRRALRCAALFLSVAGCQSLPRAGFVIPPGDAPVELVLTGDTAGWRQQLAALSGLGPARVLTVPSSGEGGRAVAGATVWTTDEWVIGYQDGRRTALQMPGGHGFARWAEGLLRSRGWRRLEPGVPRAFPESRFDAGGNVLVSPALPDFPCGRIVTSRQLQPELRALLRAQGEPLELDTRWLKVGHVDEIVAFLPVASGGFRLVLPDPEAGLALLGSVPPDRAVFAARASAQLAGAVSAGGPGFLEDRTRDFSRGSWRYVRITAGKGAGQVAHVSRAEGPRLVIDGSWDLRGESPARAIRAAREGHADLMPLWFEPPDATSRYLAVEDSRLWLDASGQEFPALVSAGELAHDQFLAAAARELAERIDGPGGVGEVVSRGLGLRPAEAVRLPVVFYDDGRGASLVSLLPNPVNLVVLEGEAVLLDPFGPRAAPADETTDVFLRAWRRAIEALGVRARFLDGWDALHRLDGGARCGTNVVRRL